MNDDTYQRLSNITDQLLKLCDCLNQKRDLVTATKLEPIVDNLTALLAEMTVTE